MRTKRPGIPKRIRPAPYVVRDLHIAMKQRDNAVQKESNWLWSRFTAWVRGICARGIKFGL